MAEVHPVALGSPLPAGGASVSPHPQATFRHTLKEALRWSAHAGQRAQARGLTIPAEEMAEVEAATARARAAGSKTAAIVTASAVYVVAPPSGVIITALPVAGPDGEGLMVNRIDTVVWVGRTQTETPGSGRTEGAHAPWPYPPGLWLAGEPDGGA